ncbi:hypothetical protein SRHO_G00189560 [Serrasalmus rhombeus]
MTVHHGTDCGEMRPDCKGCAFLKIPEIRPRVAMATGRISIDICEIHTGLSGSSSGGRARDEPGDGGRKLSPVLLVCFRFVGFSYFMSLGGGVRAGGARTVTLEMRRMRKSAHA